MLTNASHSKVQSAAALGLLSHVELEAESDEQARHTHVSIAQETVGEEASEAGTGSLQGRGEELWHHKDNRERLHNQ